jgi:gluconate 2-dehydrogenase gamma chain
MADTGRTGENLKDEGRLSRRQILRRGGALAAAAAVGTPVAAEPTADAQAAELLASQLRTFTPAEAHTLEAVLERLLPSDATGPGAKEAKLLRYIDWSLAGDLHMFAAPYGGAIAAIDAYSQAKWGGPFARLSAAQQDAVLTDMESNVATGFVPNSMAVFMMIRGHAVEGMFGDPAHGGNVGFVGWKLVHFPGPRFVVGAHDQEVGAVPKNHLVSAYSLPLFKHTKVDK